LPNGKNDRFAAPTHPRTDVLAASNEPLRVGRRKT
jgi:tripartite-type tricarboxylate transporter receptor subunit TctC